MSLPTLRLRSWGQGPRAALLLHGSTSSSATWWRAGPALAARGWSVTAPDLPAHGASPPLGAALLPAPAAEAVLAATAGRSFDVVLGHSFGAAVALALLARQPGLAARGVLEELPGPASVDWQAEAAAVGDGAAQARRDLPAAITRTSSAQPRWAQQDVTHAVGDLACCHEGEIATGLLHGPEWVWPHLSAAADHRVLLLLAPDAAGVNHLQDATALRAAEREHARRVLGARVQVVADAGHCIHRDDPRAWLDAVVTGTV